MYRTLTHTRTVPTAAHTDPEEGKCPVGDDMSIRVFLSESRPYRDICDAIAKALRERHDGQTIFDIDVDSSYPKRDTYRASVIAKLGNCPVRTTLYEFALS